MPTLDDLKTFGTADQMADGRLSVLLKGQSGSGKTRSALTFPGPIYLVYADVNRETVRKMVRDGETDLHPKSPHIRSWSEFADVVVPHLSQRKLDATTIVVDTIDFLSDLMWRDIEGSRGKLTMQDFGIGLRRLGEVTRALTSCTIPMNDHPGYHVVFTSHLKDITDDGGSLLKVAPAIMGQFAHKIEDYFDYVLLMVGESGREIRTEGGQQKSVPTKLFKVYSVSPDRFNTCKGGGMPAEFQIKEGERAFEVMNQWWKVGALAGGTGA